MDPEVRRVACKVAVANDRFRSAQAMARSSNLDLPESTAAKQSLSYAADYHWSTFSLLHKERFVHISCDSTTISGEDTLTIAFWSPTSQKAGWMIPQALFAHTSGAFSGQLTTWIRVAHSPIVHTHSLVVQPPRVSEVRYICCFAHAQFCCASVRGATGSSVQFSGRSGYMCCWLALRIVF